MSRPIFLSYRRSDSGDASLRLYEAIRRRFGADSIYMDTASTAWGEEWPSALEDAIAEADVVIVVIGSVWINAQGEWGRRRIDQPNDWVRREIELALGLGKATLPVLVGDVAMPPPEALPPEIAELGSRQALPLRDEEWHQHVEDLLTQLESRMSESHFLAVARRGQPRGETSVRAQFRAVASRFYGASMDDRIAAAEEIANLGGLLPFDEVLAFARSKEAGERVAAAVALAAHLQTSERVRNDAELQSALRALLNDGRSRVRYRAVEVLRGTPALVAAYKEDLSWIAGHDENRDVRVIAGKALARAGLNVG
jgi:HEAT repeat protein